MGIPKNRYNSGVELFLCVICTEVAIDPLLIHHCEHYICRGCATADLKTCPTCGSAFLYFKEMCIALKRVYNSMKLTCENNDCNEVLTMGNYFEHKINCPKGYYECAQSCGFKIQMIHEENIRNHHCITYLLEKSEEYKQQIVHLESNNDDRQLEINSLNKKIHELESNNNGEKPRETCEDENSDSFVKIEQRGNRLQIKNSELQNRIKTLEKHQLPKNTTVEIGGGPEFRLTNDQLCILSLFEMPKDISKLINGLAKILFGDELLTTTAANLDKMKIRFISNYARKASGYLVDDTMVKFRLNKKRQNLKRKYKIKGDSVTSAKKARKSGDKRSISNCGGTKKLMKKVSK